MPTSRFTRANLDLAKRFMNGPRGAGTTFPNMTGFASTPAGKSLLSQVIRNSQRRQGLSTVGRRP